MGNLIERYIYDVTRRLPEKEREEVSKELSSNIYDMLPQNADEDQVKEVLYQLGSPSSLAEKYRQKPRYLISPAIYDDYIQMLKWIVPLVGGVLLTIGMILGALDAIKDEMVHLSYFISSVLSKGISMGVSAAFQTFVWTTVGYAIAERVGTTTASSQEHEWKIEDLPEPTPNHKGRIPLADSVIELVLTVVFSVAVILVCSGLLPIDFVITHGDIEIVQLFSSDFLKSCIPALAMIAFLGICECIAKIMVRYWTPFVCVTVIISNLISMGILVYLINRSDLFTEEFFYFLKSQEWDHFVFPVILFSSVIIVVCSLAQCISAVYKTVRNEKLHNMR